MFAISSKGNALWSSVGFVCAISSNRNASQEIYNIFLLSSQLCHSDRNIQWAGCSNSLHHSAGTAGAVNSCMGLSQYQFITGLYSRQGGILAQTWCLLQDCCKTVAIFSHCHKHRHHFLSLNQNPEKEKSLIGKRLCVKDSMCVLAWVWC